MSREKAPEQPLADAVARDCKLSDAARGLLHEGQEADAFLTLLGEKHLHADGLRFAAYRLPKREAIWWGSLCVWEMDRPEPPPQVLAALQAVVDWVRKPSEEHRRSAEAVGNAAGLDTPAGFLALAVFVSGGSLSLPGLPAVAPDALLTAKMVANAVLLASWTVPPGQTPDCQRRFLGMAGEVIQNGAGCPPLEPSPAGGRP